MMCQRLCVVINITAHEFVQYYQGAVDSILATTTDGRTIKFPINILRPFVKSNGVHGKFELVFNDQFKLVSVNRVDV